MDDFPAGPASPEPRRPVISVVIPVYNGASDLERCLRGVRSNSGVDFEIVVVDDGSTDHSSRVAESFGTRIIRHETPRGPAAARNAGAEAALAPVVFFLDADVVPHHDVLRRALERFDTVPGLAGLFGSYDNQPAAPGIVSPYRNLLHHYVHQQGNFVNDARPVHTFWTGCGAIRRSVFLEIGGFDPSLYRRPAIEDIELGYRLSRSGHRILLCRDIQATHLKRWTLRSVIRTDIFCRGVPWMLLMMRSNTAENDLNVSQSQRASVAAVGMAFATLPLLLKSPLGILLPLICLALVGCMNRDFYRFLSKTRGVGFAIASFPLHLVYFCCCGASVAIALAIKSLPRPIPDRQPTPSIRTEPGSPIVPAPKTNATPANTRESQWNARP